MSKAIRVPDLGGASDVEVIEIYVTEGDDIAAEDPLLALESDKASMDIPAPEGGRIASIKVKIGDKLSEGDIIAELEDAESNDKNSKNESDDSESQHRRPEQAEAVADSQQVNEEATDTEVKATASSAETDDDHEEGTDGRQSGLAKNENGKTEILTVPDLGDFGDVPVIEISVAVGDVIKAEDSLVVLESDKATMDVPASKGGTIIEILVAVNDKVRQGSPVVRISLAEHDSQSTSAKRINDDAKDAQADDQTRARSKETASDRSENEDKTQPQSSVDDQEATDDDVSVAGSVHAGPAVRKLARELGVNLGRVDGSGPRHRILKEDLQGFVKSSMKAMARTGQGGTYGGAIPLPDFAQFGEVSRRAMTRIEKLTAENMSRSWQTVPHVTQFNEADISELEEFRKSQKETADRQKTRLTILPFVLKACAIALKRIPQFNGVQDFDRHEFVQKHYINIGIAVDTPAGLLVPVIRNVDEKSIWALARECIELADKARDKKLKASEMQGGCFTISSLGAIGGTAFTPIVNTPELAILGISRASIKPVYIDGGFQPRLILPLSLSYDHRAVNGADAARFSSLLAELLGDIRHMLL